MLNTRSVLRLVPVLLVALTALLLLGFSVALPDDIVIPSSGDVRLKTKEFIGYYQSIKLTPEQTRIKEEVLGAIPAPCCAQDSLLKCCCPCNLAKSAWGLSHYLIAKKGYDAAKLKKAMHDWLKLTNGNGYTGDACYEKRCGQPFAANGCGGMNQDQLVF